MQCQSCLQENPPQAKFCLNCGTGLALTCPQCRTELPGHAKFCFACGHALADTTPRSAPLPASAPRAIPEPPHLAERIRFARESLEGERKQVARRDGDFRSAPPA